MSDDTHSPSRPITGLILAGGAGRRMGGQDKGWLSWHGMPLVQHAVACLQDQVAELLISANRHLADYAALGFPVLADETPDYRGPLMGLRQGLAAARQPWLLSVPVDAPRLPDDLVPHLWAQHEVAPLVLARTPGGPQPVVCLCRRDLLPHLESYLAAGGRQVQGWYRDLPHVWVDFDEDAFFNCNYPEDLQA